MTDMNFKVWIERVSTEPLRDLRFGYSMNPTRQTPSIAAQAASGVVDGLGGAFRDAMGADMPQYGQGYHNYFDPVTQVMEDKHNFMITTTVAYDPENDDLHAVYEDAKKKMLENPDAVNKAQQHRIDLRFPQKYKPVYDNVNKTVRFTFFYKINPKTSDILAARMFRPFTGTT